MILIADSGSTKTEWRIIHNDNSIDQFKTLGFNPYLIGASEIIEEITKNLAPRISSKPDEIHFYGAGCSNEKNNKIVKDALAHFWPSAKILVEHDLLAAARSLCIDEPGIACILGTGANSCYYDGKEITDNVPSLGYVLGDEGGGSYLGIQFIKEYARGNVPDTISDRFNNRFGLSLHDILNKTYSESMPNRFLASFAKFIFQNSKDPFLYKLVYDAFELFLENNVMKYQGFQQSKVHFTGSIAFYFGNILRQVASDKNIIVKNIVEGPIAGLTLYHQKMMLA